MIEAMACGTPVIAFNRGSVPEVIDDGVTGFIVEDEAEAVAAIGKLGDADRRAGPRAIRDALDRPAHGGGLCRRLRAAVPTDSPKLRAVGDRSAPRAIPAGAGFLGKPALRMVGGHQSGSRSDGRDKQPEA